MGCPCWCDSPIARIFFAFCFKVVRMRNRDCSWNALYAWLWTKWFLNPRTNRHWGVRKLFTPRCVRGLIDGFLLRPRSSFRFILNMYCRLPLSRIHIPMPIWSGWSTVWTREHPHGVQRDRSGISRWDPRKCSSIVYWLFTAKLQAKRKTPLIEKHYVDNKKLFAVMAKYREALDKYRLTKRKANAN